MVKILKTIDFGYHHTKHYKMQSGSRKTILISLVLTLIFAFLEFFGGIISGSLALVSDSFHMFSDVGALLFSMIAIYYASKRPTSKFTYGYLRLEVISAFVNGIALIAIAIGIIYEGINRFFNPLEINFYLMISIAVVGLIINIVLTMVLVNSLKRENNLNVRSAMWHFFGDLLNSIGVIIAGIIVKLTGLVIFDTIISIVISIVIFAGGFKICKEAYYILMEAVPEGLDVKKIRDDILTVEGVRDIHEFHLWSISSGLYSLSFHVVLMPLDGINDYVIINKITELLREKYGIDHVTIQIENIDVNVHSDVE